MSIELVIATAERSIWNCDRKLGLLDYFKMSLIEWISEVMKCSEVPCLSRVVQNHLLGTNGLAPT